MEELTNKQILENELTKEKIFLKDMQAVVDTRQPFLTQENSNYVAVYRAPGCKEFINRKKVRDQKERINQLELKLKQYEQKDVQPAQSQESKRS